MLADFLRHVFWCIQGCERNLLGRRFLQDIRSEFLKVHVQLEEGLEKEVKEVEYALENDLTSFGKGFTVIEKVIALPRKRPFCG